MWQLFKFFIKLKVQGVRKIYTKTMQMIWYMWIIHDLSWLKVSGLMISELFMGQK